MNQVVAFIQARCSSSRFPNKVLAPIGGTSMIEFMVARARRSQRASEVVVITSTDPSDDALVTMLEGADIRFHRGDLNDVLARFGSAATRFPAAVYVRLTGDCPIIDPILIDGVITGLATHRADYASNVDPPTFPDGLDVEAFTAEALATTLRHAKLPSEREHVTLWMRSKEAAFKRWSLNAPCDMSSIRLTVDYPDDLRVIQALAAELGSPLQADLYDCLRVLGRRPELLAANPHARNEGLTISLNKETAHRTAP